MVPFWSGLVSVISIAVLLSAPTSVLAVGEGDVNNPFCWFTSFCKPFESTVPDYESHYNCYTDEVQGGFTAVPYRYRVKGHCILVLRDKKSTTFGNDKVAATVNWSADGTYNPTNSITMEAIAFSVTRYDIRGSPTSQGTITAYRPCAKDPWQEGQPCGPMKPPDKTGTVDPDTFTNYLHLNIPLSADISDKSRAALQQQYAHAMQIQQLQRLQNTPAGATTKSLPSLGQRASNAGVSQGATQAPILFGPLTITLPVANSRVVQGKMQINASPPTGFTDINSANTWLEFTWLDTPPTAKVRPYVNTYPVALSALMKGHAVPVAVTAGQTGRWQVRARITQPALGAWSTAVPFILTLQ